MHELGSLEPHLMGYHSRTQLFPVSYRASRQMQCTRATAAGGVAAGRGPVEMVSSVVRGAQGPQFRVSMRTPQWAPWSGARSVLGLTPGGCGWKLLKLSWEEDPCAGCHGVMQVLACVRSV